MQNKNKKYVNVQTRVVRDKQTTLASFVNLCPMREILQL